MIIIIIIIMIIIIITSIIIINIRAEPRLQRGSGPHGETPPPEVSFDISEK